MRWRARCATRDPRTLEQRRSDALGALGHGGDRLACGCDDPACEAAGVQPSAVVVHVVADEESLTDDTPVQLDGESAPGPTAAELRQMTIREALSPRPEDMIARFSATAPAVIIGGGMLPAPLLAAKIARTAKIVPIVHPGDCAAGAALHSLGGVGDVRALPRPDVPVPRLRRPRRRLRCGPHHPVSGGAHAGGQSEMFVPKTPPAQDIPGLAGSTTPRWHGGVDLAAGQSYTTHPGSRLLFPRLCRPTAAVTAREHTGESGTGATNRGLMMPRRKQTRAQNAPKTSPTNAASTTWGRRTHRRTQQTPTLLNAGH